MLKLILQDVTPETVEELRRRAEPKGRTVEAEARALLEAALGLSRGRALRAARGLRESLAGQTFSDSAELIRAARER
ncbi:MAG TPA: plasmid stabilization protein [Thermoanaerobaculia bacterium]|nr:plasmid stabilization protein [Thermoanaerobaculia bacterium]